LAAAWPLLGRCLAAAAAEMSAVRACHWPLLRSRLFERVTGRPSLTDVSGDCPQPPSLTVNIDAEASVSLIPKVDVGLFSGYTTPHGTPRDPPWDPHGTPMGPPWDPHGTPPFQRLGYSPGKTWDPTSPPWDMRPHTTPHGAPQDEWPVGPRLTPWALPTCLIWQVRRQLFGLAGGRRRIRSGDVNFNFNFMHHARATLTAALASPRPVCPPR